MEPLACWRGSSKVIELSRSGASRSQPDGSKNVPARRRFGQSWRRLGAGTTAARRAGFGDVDARLQRPSGPGDRLAAWAKAVDFALFRPELQAVLARADGGRPPFDPVMTVERLVIQAQNDLADGRAAFLVDDRLSFMRFPGHSLGYR